MRLLSISLLMVAVLPLALCRDSHTCAHLQCDSPLGECCEQSFGAQCYNPDVHRCAEHNSSLYLCPLSYPNACGRACYNSSEYHCVDGKLVRGAEPESEEPQEPTEEPQEPTEEPQEPTEEPQLPTDEPQEPTEEPQLPTDEPQEPTDEPEEPTEEPQLPTDEPEVPTEEPASACAQLNCSGSLSECCLQSFGAQCYDPLIHTCAEFNSSYYLCPLYFPKACGGACYDPATYSCEDDELQQGAEEGHQPTDGPTPGPTDGPTPGPTEGPTDPTENATKCSESTCQVEGLSCCEIENHADGSTIAQCYSDNVYACKGKVLCLLGLESCGHACYHTDYFTCEDGELKSKSSA